LVPPEKTSPFFWSLRRGRRLETCPRAYWYDYYGTRNGWRATAPAWTRALYAAKQLKGPRQWVGLRVHTLAETALKALSTPISPGLDALQRQWSQENQRLLDEAQAELWRTRPGKALGFEGQALQGATPPDFTALAEDVEAQGEALLHHPVLQRLLRVNDRIVEVDRMTRTQLGDVRVMLAPDVVVRDGRGGMTIIDWKTGTPHPQGGHQEQLLLYAAYVSQRYRLPLTQLNTMEVFTRDGSFHTDQPTYGSVASVLRWARESRDAMVDRLDDPHKDRASIGPFPATPSASDTCPRCLYREICPETERVMP